MDGLNPDEVGEGIDFGLCGYNQKRQVFEDAGLVQSDTLHHAAPSSCGRRGGAVRETSVVTEA